MDLNSEIEKLAYELYEKNGRIVRITYLIFCSIAMSKEKIF